MMAHKCSQASTQNAFAEWVQSCGCAARRRSTSDWRRRLQQLLHGSPSEHPAVQSQVAGIDSRGVWAWQVNGAPTARAQPQQCSSSASGSLSIAAAVGQPAAAGNMECDSVQHWRARLEALTKPSRPQSAAAVPQAHANAPGAAASKHASSKSVPEGLADFRARLTAVLGTQPSDSSQADHPPRLSQTCAAPSADCAVHGCEDMLADAQLHRAARSIDAPAPVATQCAVPSQLSAADSLPAKAAQGQAAEAQEAVRVPACVTEASDACLGASHCHTPEATASVADSWPGSDSVLQQSPEKPVQAPQTAAAASTHHPLWQSAEQAGLAAAVVPGRSGAGRSSAKHAESAQPDAPALQPCASDAGCVSVHALQQSDNEARALDRDNACAEGAKAVPQDEQSSCQPSPAASPQRHTARSSSRRKQLSTGSTAGSMACSMASAGVSCRHSSAHSAGAASADMAAVLGGCLQDFFATESLADSAACRSKVGSLQCGHGHNAQKVDGTTEAAGAPALLCLAPNMVANV